MSIQHAEIEEGDRHGLANWEVSAVLALDSLQVTSADVGKVAHVIGVGNYMLANASPMVWEDVVSREQLSVDNVDNTSDEDKPVSLAQAAAISAAQAAAIANAIQRANHTGTQTAATISDFNSVASAAAPVQSVNGDTGTVVVTPGSIGAVATADIGDTVCELVTGVVPTSRLPALAVVEYLGTVASQAAMLALTGQMGDWCIRSDLGYVFVIVGANPALLASWQSLAYPAAPVSSVNGHTGTVTLSYSDVGADAAGSALAAQTAAIAYAIQRANHSGSQLAATISDFSTEAKSAVVGTVNGLVKANGAGVLSAAVAGTDYLAGLYSAIPAESWLIEDFLGYYGSAQWLQTVTATTRSLVTGAAHGMSDGFGVMRYACSGSTAGGYVTCGWATSITVPTIKLNADTTVLFASIAIEDFGTAGSAPIYYVALSSAGIPVTGFSNPYMNDQLILTIMKDGGGIAVRAKTDTGGVPGTTDDYSAYVALTANTRINIAIVATSSRVRYYVNGTLFRDVTDPAKITAVALQPQVGYQTYSGTAVGAFVMDIVGLGRKNATPRALQLPTL